MDIVLFDGTERNGMKYNFYLDCLLSPDKLLSDKLRPSVIHEIDSWSSEQVDPGSKLLPIARDQILHALP
jgi:hypothetical protein